MKHNALTELHLWVKRYLPKDLLTTAPTELNQKLSAIDPKNKIRDFIAAWLSDSVRIKLQTSGSTGSPKKIEFSKASLIKSAQATATFFDLKADDRALLCLPVEYIAGKMMVVRAFVCGFNLIPVKPSANPLSGLDQSFDFAAMTPMQVYRSFELPDGEVRLNAIKTLIIGGGAISSALLHKIEGLTNNCSQTYGMTETLTHVAVRRLNGENISEHYVGLPGFKFSVDTNSCLGIETPYPEFPVIQTHDVVQLISDTSFNFLGRLDFVINSGGVKLFPENIEYKLHDFFKQRIVISSLPDRVTGEQVVLVIESNEKVELSIEDIEKIQGLKKIERPRQIVVLKAFPETASGKINRLKIKELIQNNN